MLHEPQARAAVAARIRTLRPDSPRLWGTMTIDQMLWHLNQALLNALGQLDQRPMRSVVPGFILRPLVLNLPWPRGARTAPALRARGTHDFEQERARLLELMDALCARDLAGSWADHVAFGPMGGRDWSRLMYKHVDHHLRQFSA